MKPNIICLLFSATILSVVHTNGQTTTTSPLEPVSSPPKTRQEALDIAVNASKQAGNLKKMAGVFGEFGAKELEEKYAEIDKLHKETLDALSKAISTAEKVQLQNSFLEKKKEVLKDAVSMVEAVLPKFNAVSVQMQKVIGEFG